MSCEEERHRYLVRTHTAVHAHVAFPRIVGILDELDRLEAG